MKNKKYALFAALGLGVLGAGGALLSRAQSPVPARSENRPQPVALVAVEAGGFPSSEVVVSGQLEAWKTATVSAQVAERVLDLPLTLGQRVESEQLLARLDDRVARAQLAEARAGAEQARAGREQLEAEYRRAEIETQAAIDAAQAQVGQAAAGIRQARAARRAAAETESKTRTATRAQELASAEAALRKAEADARFAEAERVRFQTLFDEGVIARQALDRVVAGADAASAGRDAARSALSLAKEGARREDIAQATAGLAQADAAIQSGEAKRLEAEAGLRQSGSRDARLTALRRQIEGLRAEEDRARARASQATLLVGKHRIVAPFAGRVLEKRTERGESVAAGTPVVRVGEVRRLKATFAVPESARGGLSVGSSVSVTVDALPGRTLVGRVSALGADGSVRTRTFPVEVTLDNSSEALLPGQSARLRLSDSSASAPARPTVPVSAVVTDGKGACVYTVENGVATRIPVTLGAVLGERVEARGIEIGTKIVETPQRVVEGQRVEAIR